MTSNAFSYTQVILSMFAVGIGPLFAQESPRYLKVPSQFASIQEALDDAEAGDVVAVRGTHTVNVVLTKPIIFRGYFGTKIIPADPNLPGITIATDDVSVKRFVIEGGQCGVLVKGGHAEVLIDYVDVNDAIHGFVVEPGSEVVELTKCDVLRSSSDSFVVNDSLDLELRSCHAESSQASGFRFENCHDLSANDCIALASVGDGFDLRTCSGNLVGSVTSGNHVGFRIESNDLALTNCLAVDNRSHGFHFIGAAFNDLFSSNSIDNGGNGVMLDQGSANNTIRNHVSLRNWQDGYWVGGNSSNNTLLRPEAFRNGGSGVVLSTGASQTTVIDALSIKNDDFTYVDLGQGNVFTNARCDNGASNPPGICTGS